MALPCDAAVRTGDGYYLVWPEESAKRPLIERLQTFLTAQTPDARRQPGRSQIYRVGEFGLSLFAGMPNTQNINRCRLHLVTYLIAADQNTPHFLR